MPQRDRRRHTRPSAAAGRANDQRRRLPGRSPSLGRRAPFFEQGGQSTSSPMRPPMLTARAAHGELLAR